jgi:DNA-binding transcriptional ArsR family regulator
MMPLTISETPNPAVLARTFQALADEKRIRILELLGGGELCVCDLASALGLSQPLLSFHLRTLREAGLVGARKQGRWVHYSLIREAIETVVLTAEALSEGTYESRNEIRTGARRQRCRPRRDI